MQLENKKIVLYTHNDGGTGNYDDELFNFLLKNDTSDLVRVDFPFGKKSEKSIRLKRYKVGKLFNKFESRIKFSSPEFISYTKDFIYGLYYGLRFSKNTDLFFGMDNLLTLIGLFFKRLGFVKEVVYVILDYSPKRYDNGLIDRIYYFVDKI